MGSPDHRERHVGVLVETDDTWGRNVVEAACQYGGERGWSLLIYPRDGQGRLRVPRGWGGAGVIASLRNAATIKHVQRLGVPVVDVSMMVAEADWFVRVATDDFARAAMALEHLQERGLRQFACYAPPIGRYSDSRAAAFSRVVGDAGFECFVYQQTRSESVGWLTNYPEARRWLGSLPRPLGLFAADPYPARQLLEICVAEGIRVPDEVAILAGDDDDLLCNVARPQISSVELASHQIGETAASVLEDLMAGRIVTNRTRLIPPLRVRARHSTDVLAIEDDEIADILRFIRSRAATGLQVSDIVAAFPVSRRSLEQRFRKHLNRSPAEEIRRARFDRVRRLLLDTDLSIASVAYKCGFASGASLSQAFQKHLGQTPASYRAARGTGDRS